MRLLVNVSMLAPNPTGLGVYALRCLEAACAGFETEVAAPEHYAGDARVVLRAPAHVGFGAGRGAALRRWLWSRAQNPFAGRLIYSPTHHGFLRGDASVFTVHDLIALRFPRQHPTQYLFFRRQLPRQLARCAAVFTVSETTRQDLHQTYAFPLDRIHVVPNGVDRTIFKPPPSDTPREPFLLMVGAAYPHKNVEELFHVSQLWRNRYRLVVASCRGRYRAQLERQLVAHKLEQRVTFLPYLRLEELVRLYQTCSAFIYPSRWEGFGIPPLEALACGAPVIASDIPAHREVLGDCARFVTLGQESSWGDAFAALQATEPTPRLLPLELYTWERTGAALCSALSSVEPRLLQRAIA